MCIEVKQSSKMNPFGGETPKAVTFSFRTPDLHCRLGDQSPVCVTGGGRVLWFLFFIFYFFFIFIFLVLWFLKGRFLRLSPG